MSHAEDEVPDYIVLAHYNDDTHIVVCHYHHLPEEAELNDMCADFYREGHNAKGLIRFQFAAVKFDTTPVKLELSLSQ